MFQLTTKTGEPVLMKNCEPFIYSSKSLAQIARKLLEGERKEALTVVKQ